jgi:hypothetical protein
MGRSLEDQSLFSWLLRNSHQLEALTLHMLWDARDIDDGTIPAALAAAAQAAAAAGRPLQMHTLRVIRGHVRMSTICQLLESLPALRCLQLQMVVEDVRGSADEDASLVMQHPAVLQCAAPLEELYLYNGYYSLSLTRQPFFKQLLPNLKRLSWDSSSYNPPGVLSCATQLTFLYEELWTAAGGTSGVLPPGLQQLHVGDFSTGLELLQEHREVVTGWGTYNMEDKDEQQLLACLPNLKALIVEGFQLCSPGVPAFIKQLSSVSALTLHTYHDDEQLDMQVALDAAASMPNLRCLHLDMSILRADFCCCNMAALSQLKQLRLQTGWVDSTNEQQWRRLTQDLGRMAGLQRLSVPHVLLTVGQEWLRGLQQLRVLTLRWPDRTSMHVSTMPWLEGCRWEALPPQLQVLGASGIKAEEAASWQLRRCLQQVVGSSGCEVVVGVDLDEAADPVQQLAGLPVALQRALA